MRIARWIAAAVMASSFAGCATVEAPGPQLRQALAPTGKVRVAFIAVPLYATKDAATGELRGQAVDLGKEIARRVGLPFQAMPYPNPAAVVAAAKAGEFDVVLMGINAERAAAIEFSAPYLEVEQGFLVRPGVPITSIAELDKPGIRIAVLEKAGADMHLTASLKNASLIRAKSVDELFGSLDGKADVVAGTKTALFERVAGRPGARVLDGRFLVEPVGMGVPKGRNPAAAAYVARFAQDAKSSGLVKAAIDAAGLRGVSVPK
jgi:polar amino acid transport system substrate-binding protein